MKRRIGVVFEGCNSKDEDAEKIAVLVPEDVATVKDLKRLVVPKTSTKDKSWTIYQKRFVKDFLKNKKKEGHPHDITYKFKSSLYFLETGLHILDEDTLEIVKDNDIICCKVTAKPSKQSHDAPTKKAPQESQTKPLASHKGNAEEPLPPPSKKPKAQTSIHLFFDSDGEATSQEKRTKTDDKKESETEPQTKKKRRRRRKPKKKETEALENVSVILDSANPPPPNTPAHKVTAPASEKPWDFEGSERLGRLPEKGEVVGWKEVYLNEKMTPEYTDWKVGTVLSVETESKIITFEEPGQDPVTFSHMLMPKLVRGNPQTNVSHSQESNDTTTNKQNNKNTETRQEESEKCEPQRAVSEKTKRIPSCKGIAATLAHLKKSSYN